ncbi:hypothetical protein ACFL6L_02190 [candidate division KSB1 bacterium]
MAVASREMNNRANADRIEENKTNIYQYAAKWAYVMELAMNRDNIDMQNSAAVSDWIFENAGKYSNKVNAVSNGFMCGFAVNILEKTWVYGVELSLWHNLTFQEME